MSNDYNLPCYGDDTIWIKIQINVECINNFLQKIASEIYKASISNAAKMISLINLILNNIGA